MPFATTSTRHTVRKPHARRRSPSLASERGSRRRTFAVGRIRAEGAIYPASDERPNQQAQSDE
jgi:hypothetical protein